MAAADGVLRLNDTSSIRINRERAAMSELPWYVYLLQFVGGLLLANGVPYFVQGISGHRFQTAVGLLVDLDQCARRPIRGEWHLTASA